MLTEDEWKRMRHMIEEILDVRGVKPPAERSRSLNAERQRRFRERNADSNAKVTPPRAKRNVKSNGDVTPTAATWAAYATAYKQRYGVDPVRNAMVNSSLAAFVGRVGAAEAPQVAAFYVRSNRGLYVSAKHPVNLLIRNAEALRTEWATGRAGTHTEAMQADRTQSNANVWGKLIAEAEERERDGTK